LKPPGVKDSFPLMSSPHQSIKKSSGLALDIAMKNSEE